MIFSRRSGPLCRLLGHNWVFDGCSGEGYPSGPVEHWRCKRWLCHWHIAFDTSGLGEDELNTMMRRFGIK